MKLTERILILLAILGILFKIQHYPGGSFFTIIGICLLACLYMFGGIILFTGKTMTEFVETQKIGSNRIMYSVAVGISLAVALIGVLFKIQAYPGAQVNLILGSTALLITISISGFKLFKNGDAYHKGILGRTASVLVLILLLFMIPKRSWLEYHFPDNPEFIKASLEYDENPTPENRQLKDSLFEEGRKRYYEELEEMEDDL